MASDKIPELAFCLYQAMFAGITPALAIGMAVINYKDYNLSELLTKLILQVLLPSELVSSPHLSLYFYGQHSSMTFWRVGRGTSLDGVHSLEV